MIVCRSLQSLLLFFMLTGALARAESPSPTLDALVKSAVQPHLDKHEIAGCAIAIARGDETRYFYFGQVNVDKLDPPTESTFYEIGSITKTFTGTLLALAIADGAVALDTPVQSLLPDGVSAPKYNDRAITLFDLTTHSSGLPRMPTNWHPTDGNAPYIDYNASKLYEFLNGYTLERSPGEKYEYSNLATALLGHVLARKANMDYEPLLRQRILAPLDMNATHIHSSPEQLALLATGYASHVGGDGNRILAEQGRWDFDVFQSAGGIRSNIVDMAKYLHATMAPPESPLGRAMDAAQQPRYTANDHLSIGFNWHILTKTKSGRPIVWHNGQTGGYHAFLGLDQERHEGVVYLSNTNFDSDGPALDILNALPNIPSLNK